MQLLLIAALGAGSHAMAAGATDFTLSVPDASEAVRVSPQLSTQIRRVSPRMLVFVLKYPSMEVAAESAATEVWAVRFIVNVLGPRAVTPGERLLRVTETSRTPSLPGKPWRSGEQDGKLMFTQPLSARTNMTIQTSVFKGGDGEWVSAEMPIMRSTRVTAGRRYEGNLEVQYEYSLNLHLSPEEADRFALAALQKHLNKETKNER